MDHEQNNCELPIKRFFMANEHDSNRIEKLFFEVWHKKFPDFNSRALRLS